MEKALRKLARSSRFQLLYIRAKEMHGIHIFRNTSDFSFIQLQFLHWLGVYDSLYNDLYSKSPYISKEVIEDDIRTDAYLLYKQRYGNKQPEAEKLQSSGGIPQVIFRRK